jgi:calcineurin-like phosphoesterase family protein
MSRDRSRIDFTADPQPAAWLRPPFFVIGDTHYGHRNIAKYCGRPDYHERLMRERWQETVGDDDWVLHLGDVAMKPAKAVEFITALPGHKLLILGNHDRSTVTFYRDQCGFEAVGNGFTLDYHGWHILFAHRPDDAATFVRYPKHLQVHGHIHEKTRRDRRLINVSVEQIGYRPRPVTEILDTRIAELTGAPVPVLA